MRKLVTVVLTIIIAVSFAQPVFAATYGEKIAEAVTTYNNTDIRGWLYLPGTTIDRPLAFSPLNNSYYNSRTLTGYDHVTPSAKVVTSEFISNNTNFGTGGWQSGSRNYVVFGHNWTNVKSPLRIGPNSKDEMFAQLPSYTSMEFLKTNPHIYFSTDKAQGIWRVFCVTYAEVSDKFSYVRPFNEGWLYESKDDFAAHLVELGKRSMISGVDVNSDDVILTLSTCTREFGAREDQRFVVVARLLRPGESVTDTVEYTAVEGWKKPVFD